MKVAGSLSYTENFSQTKRSSEAGGEEAGTSVQELQTQSNSAGGGKKISAAPLFHDVFPSEKSLLAAEKHRVSKAGVPFVSCLFFFFQVENHRAQKQPMSWTPLPPCRELRCLCANELADVSALIVSKPWDNKDYSFLYYFKENAFTTILWCLICTTKW